MTGSDPYSVLGLTYDADEEVIKAAYRALSKKHHPDRGGDEETFKQINDAYRSLMNDNKSKANHQSRGGRGNGLFGGMFTSEPVETKSTAGKPDYGISVEGDYFTATIIGIQHNADIRDIVFEHQLSERNGHHRTVILYDLHNTSDQVIYWTIEDSKYIGDDSYTYTHSEYYVDESSINNPWKGTSVEIEGGTKSKFIEIVEKMPEGVTLSKIIHTLSINAPGRVSGWVEDKERFEFVIDEGDLSSLEEPP